MGCAQLHRRNFTVSGDMGFVIDSHVDALNRMKYVASTNTYAGTVWGALIGSGYSGIKRYGYYGRKQHGLYEHNMRYGRQDAYERRSLYAHIAINEQPSYLPRDNNYELPEPQPEVQVRDEISGAIYLASRRSETPDRADELQFRIAQERMSGIEGAEVINFSERARQLHDRIRNERSKISEGDMREAA